MHEEQVLPGSSGEIYAMIDEARKLIQEGRIADARGIYAKIGRIYSSLRAEQMEKRHIYYAVLELKTDIELAGMA